LSVYVDNGRRPLRMKRGRRAVMCHMLADTEEELHTMAARLGLRREWYQGDHYDIALVNRRKAVEYGAVEITQREAVLKRRAYRGRAAIP
jgi:adenylyl- and sulfurtransferase ThiI